MKCPRCGFRITRKRSARAMGGSTSEAKAQAARENGKKGGRPPGSKKLKGSHVDHR